MITFLNFFISSFAQLLSSPSFTTMANKSVLNAVDHRASSSSPFGSQDDIHTASGALGADERHSRHVELEPSLRVSLLKSSSPKRLTLSDHSRSNSDSGFVSIPPVPANSPSLTPSHSFPDSFEDAFILTSPVFSGAHSAYPTFGPSASSTLNLDLSLISGCSEEDFHLSDSTLISSGRDTQPSRGVGLGITGVKKHDGSGQFDGVGLVSIRRWMPRSPRISHEPNTFIDPFRLSEPIAHYDLSLHEQGDAEISDTFLQEAAMTFIHDPFHIHSLATIPECQSWSELDTEEGETCDSVSVDYRNDFEDSHAKGSDTVSTIEKEVPLRRTRKHFSASTISSELKRTSASTSVGRMYLGRMRTRSSTWPSHARSRLEVKSRDGDSRVIN